MIGILVDTSIWIEHFRRGHAALGDLLQRDLVLTHPLILGEIACGTPPDRASTLSNLSLLARARAASQSEILELIERERLYCLGCGWIDVSLLASALVTPDARLWTRDRRLDTLTKRFGVSFQP